MTVAQILYQVKGRQGSISRKVTFLTLFIFHILLRLLLYCNHSHYIVPLFPFWDTVHFSTSFYFAILHSILSMSHYILFTAWKLRNLDLYVIAVLLTLLLFHHNEIVNVTLVHSPLLRRKVLGLLVNGDARN